MKHEKYVNLRVAESDLERFWARIDRGPKWQGSHCLNWSSAERVFPMYRNIPGTKGVYLSAVRVAWHVIKGEVSPRGRLWGQCGNPKCVNPAHFTVGAYAAVTRRKMRRAQLRRRGINEPEIAEALLKFAKGKTVRAVAVEHKISRRTLLELIRETVSSAVAIS